MKSSSLLEKHKRYGNAYGKNEIYWGLGIECESYFEMEKAKEFPGDFLAKNHKRERYSVDYYTSYKPDLLKQAFSHFEEKTEPIYLPVLLNSHTFTKLDCSLEHKTLYEKGTPPNPKFNGKILFDLLKEFDPEFFDKGYDDTYTFDGDSIEIMTQDFYKATVDSVLNELSGKQCLWIEKLRHFFQEKKIVEQFGSVSWIGGNHGFATMITNPNQLAIFNNGTYHINITLPTMLDEHRNIANFQQFVDDHRAFIRCIQCAEPLLVANFGSPDPLAWIDPEHYSAGSQRGAMSRYIGLGTYDTDTMKEGKLLTMDLSDVQSTWYTNYHKHSGYNPLNKIGLDINFHKHWNHGVEIRFFDWFPPSRLQGLLRFLIYLADASKEYGCELNPIKNPIWNTWMTRVIQKGADAGCTMDEARLIEEVFHVYVSPSKNLQQIFAEIYRKLHSKYSKKGVCSQYFMPKETVEKDISVSPSVNLTADTCTTRQSKCF